MIGPAPELKRFCYVVALLLLLAASAPVRSWAAGQRAASSTSDDPSAAEPRLVVLRDFNRDGIGDVAEITSQGEDAGSDAVTISLGQPDGTFKGTTGKLLLGHRAQAIASGDFNHDGIPDLIVGDSKGTLWLFLSDGRGNLSAAGEAAHLDSIKSIVVADFNHDGIADLAVSDWRASSVKVLLGTGRGTFQSGWSFPLRMAGTTPHLSAADFNGDGFIDLAVVYSSDDGDEFDVMLGDGNGLFSHSPQLSVVRDHNAYCAP